MYICLYAPIFITLKMYTLWIFIAGNTVHGYGQTPSMHGISHGNAMPCFIGHNMCRIDEFLSLIITQSICTL